MKHRRIAVITLAMATLFLLAIAGVFRHAVAAPRFQDLSQELHSDHWPQPAPEFHGTAADWLNTDGKALSMQALLQSHHVILIDFFEYTCVNCLRTLPYLQEWNKRYAKDGLVIVGIHTP